MEIVGTQIKEMKGRADKLYTDAAALFLKEDATAEDAEKGEKMRVEADEIKARIDQLVAIKAASQGLADIMDVQDEERDPEPVPENKGAPRHDGPAPQFKSLADFYTAVWMSTFRGRHHKALNTFFDAEEPGGAKTKESGWSESKDLVENVGASGGFLVPTEQRTELLQWTPELTAIRERATVIPMRRRSVQIPTLDQTGTTASQPHWWGGVLAKWTEEAGSKDETEPTFRQITLTAHKLVCYTECSDELLADSAISLEGFLAAAFNGVISWYENYAFVNGTGAGQPQGIISAGATIGVARATAGAIAIADVINMLESFQGVNPMWLASRQALSNLMQMSGPTGNASYVFMPSARDAMPHNLFGYPLFFSEMCPALGTKGDLILVDWSKYLIGDREQITVDSSKHYKFQNDLTAWRAVKRVDGQPWLSDPLTYQDGSTQVSPFVVLDDASSS